MSNEAMYLDRSDLLLRGICVDYSSNDRIEPDPFRMLLLLRTIVGYIYHHQRDGTLKLSW